MNCRFFYEITSRRTAFKALYIFIALFLYYCLLNKPFFSNSIRGHPKKGINIEFRAFFCQLYHEWCGEMRPISKRNLNRCKLFCESDSKTLHLFLLKWCDFFVSALVLSCWVDTKYSIFLLKKANNFSGHEKAPNCSELGDYLIIILGNYSVPMLTIYCIVIHFLSKYSSCWTNEFDDIWKKLLFWE